LEQRDAVYEKIAQYLQLKNTIQSIQVSLALIYFHKYIYESAFSFFLALVLYCVFFVFIIRFFAVFYSSLGNWQQRTQNWCWPWMQFLCAVSCVSTASLMSANYASV